MTPEEYWERLRRSFNDKYVEEVENAKERRITMTPNQLIDALKRLPSEAMDRPIMDDDDTIAPGWSLAPADICIGTGEFLTNGDVGVIPDPDRDPDEDLKAETGEWGMPLQRELRATLHSYMED